MASFGLEIVEELPPRQRSRIAEPRESAVVVALDWAEPPERYVAPETRRHHGTHTKYVVDKCRCEPCTVASREYEMRRRHAQQRPDEVWAPYVPAGRARAHLRELQAAGVGYKTVAAIAGLAPSSVGKILWPSRYRGMRESRRIRPETERKILAVSVADASGAQKIAAAKTWKLLDDLIGRGWSRAELARRLGNRGPGLQIKRDLVRASTARKVERLYSELKGQESPRYGRWKQRPR